MSPGKATAAASDFGPLSHEEVQRRHFSSEGQSRFTLSPSGPSCHRELGGGLWPCLWLGVCSWTGGDHVPLLALTGRGRSKGHWR